MAKIGRNDPCPCGSGKKYKKCCLNRTTKPSLETLHEEFGEFDQGDLVATLAGLQVYPENHSHSIRLQAAIRLACKTNLQGTIKVNPTKIKDILNRNLTPFGPIGILEDPLENLWTENVVFYGGNYVVHTGNTLAGAYLLQILLNTLLHYADDFPEEYINIITGTTLSLLTLSNEMARRLGHSRYMDSPDRWHQDIDVPQGTTIEDLSSSIRFSVEELKKLSDENHWAPVFLSPFVTRIGDDRLREGDIDKNPLLIRPLVHIKDKLIVTIPTTITCALRHFILVMAKQYRVLELLSERYRETIWDDVQRYMHSMLFEGTDIKLPQIGSSVPIKERVYRIDADKLAYVQLVVDDLSDYNDEEPYSLWKPQGLGETLDARRDTITKWLIGQKELECKQVFLITAAGGVGRFVSFGLNKAPKQSRTVLLFVDELRTLSYLGDCDNLSLWKYIEAKEKLLSTTDIIDMDFLNLYSFYAQNYHSFCCSSEKFPDFWWVSPEFSLNLTAKAVKKADIHAITRGNPPHHVTIRRHPEYDSIPIYLIEGGEFHLLTQVVEEYLQPIWVSYAEEDIPPDLRYTIFQLTEVLTYWIWQVTPSLKAHLDPLGMNPIHVEFRLENMDSWIESYNPNGVIPEKHIFTKNVEESTITLTLPDSIRFALQGPDNQGERIILSELLGCFSTLLSQSSSLNTLDAGERERILDEHAPSGRKKKICITDSELDAAFDPRYVPRFRTIPQHDIEEQLDGLVDELGDEAPTIEKKLGKEERIRLLQKVVDIYHGRLKSMLPQFSWRSLLERLIGYNEALWHHQAIVRVTTPTVIECYSDIQSYTEVLEKRIPDIEKSALAARTLIEIVSAEPPQGKNEVSDNALDKLLAMTHHLINWAMLSDQIHLDILDVDIRCLENGRINIDTEPIDERVVPFKREKTRERVEHAIENFTRVFDRQDTDKSESDLSEYDSAFKAEFGITLTQILNFLSSVSAIGFNQPTASPKLALSELKRTLKEELGWTEADIYKAIKLFSLKRRERWDKAPKGFDAKTDIWPWRYNRRLSYIRRPLILSQEPKDDPVVFWGPRHILRAGLYFYNLVTSGRYRREEIKSQKLRNLIGDIQSKEGKKFVREVKAWLEENSNCIVESELPIGPGQRLDANIDLGDIDVLAIDSSHKQVYSIECKNIDCGRNPREMANEIERLEGERTDSNSWISKHLKRDKWLKSNARMLRAAVNLDLSGYRISSLFLTSEEIPATYLRSLNLPFISFPRLKREGISAIQSL